MERKVRELKEEVEKRKGMEGKLGELKEEV